MEEQSRDKMSTLDYIIWKCNQARHWCTVAGCKGVRATITRAIQKTADHCFSDHDLSSCRFTSIYGRDRVAEICICASRIWFAQLLVFQPDTLVYSLVMRFWYVDYRLLPTNLLVLSTRQYIKHTQ